METTTTNKLARKIRILVVQQATCAHSQTSVEKNVNEVLDKYQNLDFVVFPECWLPFGGELSTGNPVIKTLSTIASKHKLYLGKFKIRTKIH